MTRDEKLLAELEQTVARQRHDARQFMKSMRSGGRALRSGNPAKIDLLKAELTLNRLASSGALTDAQINEGRRRLANLRPTKIIRLG